MGLRARDVMDTRFCTLNPQMTVAEAVKAFKRESEEQKQRVYGMMVTDARGDLMGILAMYDILLLMRPKHIHIWGEMDDLDVSGFLDEVCLRTKSILVGDIMATDMVTISPNTHLLQIVDLMTTKHIRRLPVLEDGKIVGIVYISKVLFYLMERLTG